MTDAAGFVPHYRLMLEGLGVDAIDLDCPTTTVATPFLMFLLEELARQHAFDEEFYRASYPDVAAAVAAGEVASGHAHYVAAGFREGRLPHVLGYDAAWYRGNHTDLDALYREGGDPALANHFSRNGRHEGRAGDEAVAAEAGRWTAAARATAPLPVQRSLPDAYVQAFAHPLVAPPPDGFCGGPVLGDKPGERRLRHRRDRLPVDSAHPAHEPPQPLAGQYVYGGPYHHHFGHVMAEMIHRILPARALFACRRLLFVGTAGQPAAAGYECLPEPMQQALRFLEVAPEDVTVIHNDRRVELLHLAEQGSDLGGGPSPAYLDQLAEFTGARLDTLFGPAEGRPRKIYVSRSRVRGSGGFLGERYLERLLEREGFATVFPETLPLVEQMNAYRGAETLIFGEGSACHGMELFGRDVVGHCVLLVRRADHRLIFERVLRPRAREFHALAHAIPLGSIVIDPVTGAERPELGVALFDLPALARSLRGLGIAALPGLDPPLYRRTAREDLKSYIAYYENHAEAGTMVRGPALAAFLARANERLG